MNIEFIDRLELALIHFDPSKTPKSAIEEIQGNIEEYVKYRSILLPEMGLETRVHILGNDDEVSQIKAQGSG